jgi:hypothetical protein
MLEKIIEYLVKEDFDNFSFTFSDDKIKIFAIREDIWHGDSESALEHRYKKNLSDICNIDYINYSLTMRKVYTVNDYDNGIYEYDIFLKIIL